MLFLDKIRNCNGIFHITTKKPMNHINSFDPICKCFTFNQRYDIVNFVDDANEMIGLSMNG